MHRATPRPVLRALALTSATAVGLLAPAGAIAAHGVTAAVSVDSAGVIGNDYSNYPDMTPDGRFVAFASSASNLVPGDTNNVGDVFVRDRRSGTTERVSLGLKGAQGDGDSNVLGIATDVGISDDGRYVAFKSEATNLVRGDRNDLTDVFVRDRVAGTTEIMSVDADGDAAGGDEPGISPDGRYVAFTTAGIDDDFSTDIYLRDRVAGTTVRISVAHDGGQPFNTSSGPSVGLAPGGPVVAFSSAADNLVPDDNNDSGDVFVRDLSGPVPVTERISVNSDEQPGTGGAGFGARGASISNDGRYVAFSSEATNFTSPAQTAGWRDVFLRDRQAGTTTLVSADATGGEADGSSEGAYVSSTGAYVSFHSFASDLVAESGGLPIQGDTYVRDIGAGTTERTSVATDDSNLLSGQFDTQVGVGPVSADGLVSVFTTNADNLQPGDDNSNQDVFARDQRPGADLALTMTDSPDPAGSKVAVTYTLTTTNQSLTGSAPGAAVVDVLPAGVTFVSASPGCTHAAGRVECQLGTLAAGASAITTITVMPKSRGTLTNTATAGSLAADPDPSDNSATETTTVIR